MKRIVICCDGTWNTPEDKLPTNVITTARAILPEGENLKNGEPLPQIVFYDWGVGTGTHSDKLSGGAMGKGLDKNVQDGYRFIVHNYQKGDELFVFGFSRGSYTARSLGGLIRNCGILTRTNSHLIPKAYNMYRSQSGPDCKTAKDFRATFSHHQESQGERPEITFMGVWDTVGALGVPLRIFRKLNNKRFKFHDTALSSITKTACHAVAIDEKRGDFKPVLWTNPPKPGQCVKQVWFTGVHSDIGGGYEEQGLSNTALHWMAKNAMKLGLGLDMNYLNGFRQNPLDQLHRSRKGVYYLKSRIKRTIEKYNAPTPEEALHPSVKIRYQGLSGYRPKKLEKFLVDNHITW